MNTLLFDVIQEQFNILISNNKHNAYLYNFVIKNKNNIDVHKKDKYLLTINLDNFTDNDIYNNSDSWNKYKSNLINIYFADNTNANNSRIPLNIFQTWHTTNLPPKMRECTEKLKKDNPEFTYYLYDDDMCRQFIIDNFNKEVLNAFNILIPGAYKADLWRYCILYIYGGVYLDIKYTCINNFKFINLVNKEYYVRDRVVGRSGIYNAMMICKPFNSILLKAIQKIVDNCKNKYYGISELEPTGPLLLKHFFSKKEIDNMELKFEHVNNRDYILLNNKEILISYKEYRNEQRKLSNVPHYGYLWKNRNIYYKKNYINQILILLFFIIIILVIYIVVNEK